MSFLQGKGVCFTGKAMLDGKAVLRADLATYVVNQGGWMVDKITGGNEILVASRTDTVKAVSAIARGIKTISYGEFFQMAGIQTHADLTSGKSPEALSSAELSRLADEALEQIKQKKRDERAKLAANDLAMEQAECIEGWGSF